MQKTGSCEDHTRNKNLFYFWICKFKENFKFVMTRGGSSNTKAPSAPSTTTSSPAPASEPGEGIRSLKTSGVFRAVNFELYAKPVSFASVLLHLFVTLEVCTQVVLISTSSTIKCNNLTTLYYIT